MTFQFIVSVPIVFMDNNEPFIVSDGISDSNCDGIMFYCYVNFYHPDAAGNPGSDVTRNVIVVKSDPVIIKTLTVGSNNSVNNSYAKAGDLVNIVLRVGDGDFGNITASILDNYIDDYRNHYY